MKQEIWKWIRANNSKTLLLKPLGADGSIDGAAASVYPGIENALELKLSVSKAARMAASVYPGIENAVVWRATDIAVGGVKLSMFDQYLESGASGRNQC